MKTIIEILLWIWQLPQNLLGLLLRLIWREKPVKYRGIDVVCSERFPDALSLGVTIFIEWPYEDEPDEWKHEWGHTRQSRILGPFYLLVIGLPSIVWAGWWTWQYKVRKKIVDYDSFFTERWANRLGGVGDAEL